MSAIKIEILPVEKTGLGEGPHWDGCRQELLYVDLTEKTVNRYSPTTEKSYKVKIDSEGLGETYVSHVIPYASNPNKFVIGHGKSLKTLEWDLISLTPTSITTIYDVVDDNLEGRFNDGKCDVQGRLWAGTMPIYSSNMSSEDGTKGSLFKLSKDGLVSKHADKIGVSNGLCWSHDNTKFYFIDSFTRCMYVFDYDVQLGTIDNKRVALDFQKEQINGVPDGMTIDSNGNLWIACFDGYQVIEVDPHTAKVKRSVQLPASKITSVCFGGKNLDILYATSSRFQLSPEELSAQPDAGSLFKITGTGAKGLYAGVGYAGDLQEIC